MLKRIGAEESGEFKAVASGTLPSGRPVVVNADGTVSSVGLVSISQNVGSGTVFESATTEYINSVFDSSTNRVVVIYKDDGNSNYGTAVVGSVSGNSISFGTPVVYQSGTVIWSKPVFDSTNNKIVIAYRKNSDGGDGGAIVGTVDASDNSISFGSETEFETGEITSDSFPLSAVFDSSQGKVVIVYREATNSNYGMAIVGTVSGTSISFGSNTAFESSNTTNIEATFDSNSNKVVIFYNASSTGKAIVGTVSGTSISFGSSANITGNDLKEIHGTFDSTNNKIIVAYKDADGTVAGEGCGIVGTVSGTSISFGSQTVFRSKNCNHVSIAFDSNVNKIVVTYQNDTDSPRVGELVVGTVSGTSISFDTQVVFDSSISSGHISYTSAVFDSNSNKVVISFADSSNSKHGTSLVFQAAGSAPNLTSENYIGMSRGVAFQTGSASVIGSSTEYESSAVSEQVAIFDSNSNKIVIVWKDDNNSNYGTAIVGDIDSSDNTISFGSQVVFESAESRYFSLAFDSNSNKIVVAYTDVGNSNHGNAIIGTVSGTSISFGSPVVFEAGTTNYKGITFDSNLNKVVLSYKDPGNSSYGTAVVGTVSGTSISFGTSAVFESAQSNFMAAAFDSNSNKVVIAYQDAGDGDAGKAVVATVSGTDVSFGSPVEFAANSRDYTISFNSSVNKVVITYRDLDSSAYGTAIVGTVSGTSISFGSATVFSNNVNANYISSAYDTSANKTLIAFQDADNSDPIKIAIGTVSGTSISFSLETIESSASNYTAIAHDSNSNLNVVAYGLSGAAGGKARVYKPDTRETTRAEVADGGNASMDIIGSVSDNQIGLTAGQQYFVQTDGTIDETADSPSVLAGTAISATELLVKT